MKEKGEVLEKITEGIAKMIEEKVKWVHHADTVIQQNTALITFLSDYDSTTFNPLYIEA